MRFGTFSVLIVGALLLTPGCRLPAQEPVAEDGLFITVTTPITSDVVNRVKETTERARTRKDRVIRKIVYDFNPNDQEAATPDFGPCFDLAVYLQGLHELTTVAYVHKKVYRHTVLPVLACKELVMGSDGRIGDVSDPKSPRTPLQEQAYAQVAGENRAAIVLKMLDPNIEVMHGRKNGAEFFFDRRRQAEMVNQGVVGIEPKPVLQGGKVALLDANESFQLGLCKLINKDSRQQVAEAYGLSANSLREDPLQGRAPVAWHIMLRGPVNEAFAETIARRMNHAVAQRANVIIFEFDSCGTGDANSARRLADKIRELKGNDLDGAPVMTVAFIPKGMDATDVATFLAFGCSEIVMGKDATLGDFSSMVGMGAAGPKRKQNQPDVAKNPKLVSESLEDLAKAQGIPPLLVRGMFDPDLEIVRVRNRVGGSIERRLLSAEEYADDQNGERKWQLENTIKHKGKTLVLSAQLAKELGVIRNITETPKVQDVYALYGLDPHKVREASPDWLDAIAEFLQYPVVAVLLVMIGAVCLILELKMPGATAPGVIAAICFVLFFWSQSQLSGQIIILAVLLFILGLILIGIEVFVMPGFGFVGISGIVLVILGLALATVERMPQSPGDWIHLGGTLAKFGIALAVAAVGAIVLAHYLPSIPIANRLILSPPSQHAEAGEEAHPLPGVEQAVALLGAVGNSATDLRPSGMAKFGEQFVDVVTEGNFIPAGARVQVIEVEGNRIVVKEV
ncbi:MAG TPA: NfeD family protein [Gemmataceae bacterium]|nr:NfeD family protein [Gemmataceae bacterium]